MSSFVSSIFSMFFCFDFDKVCFFGCHVFVPLLDPVLFFLKLCIVTVLATHSNPHFSLPESAKCNTRQQVETPVQAFPFSHIGSFLSLCSKFLEAKIEQIHFNDVDAAEGESNQNRKIGIGIGMII